MDVENVPDLDRIADAWPCEMMIDHMGIRTADIAAARRGWEKAKDLIRDPDIRFVLLDEINIALRYDYLNVADVVAFLQTEKPPQTHVVLTGRNAAEALIEAADLVTEMTLIKHPFRSGIKAQKGVEF